MRLFIHQQDFCLTLVCKEFADTFYCSAISCNHYSAYSVVVICDGISAGDVSINGLNTGI